MARQPWWTSVPRNGGLAGGQADQAHLGGVEAAGDDHRAVLAAGHHRFQADVFFQDLAAAPVDVAHGGADGGVGVLFQRFAKEVDQAALALEQAEQQQRPLGAGGTGGGGGGAIAGGGGRGRRGR